MQGSDAVYTDRWAPHGVEIAPSHAQALAAYQVTPQMMSMAKPDACFMHCLPAERGREVAAEVIDGPQSVVFEQAKNRLHVQKGIVRWCLGVL